MKAIVTGSTDHRIIIETDEEPTIVASAPAGGVAASGAERIIDKLADASDTIAAVCKALHSRTLATLEDSRPDELTLEFGVKLAGEGGIPLVTKASAEGTFVISAKWDFTRR